MMRNDKVKPNAIDKVNVTSMNDHLMAMLNVGVSRKSVTI